MRPGDGPYVCSRCGTRFYERVPEECPRCSQYAKRKRGRRSGTNINPNLRRRVYKRDGYRCVRCGSGRSITLDHIVPVSKGGPTTEGNLQTMCWECNQLKADSDLL